MKKPAFNICRMRGRGPDFSLADATALREKSDEIRRYIRWLGAKPISQGGDAVSLWNRLADELEVLADDIADVHAVTAKLHELGEI